jgi:hypothetical protein
MDAHQELSPVVRNIAEGKRLVIVTVVEPLRIPHSTDDLGLDCDRHAIFQLSTFTTQLQEIAEDAWMPGYETLCWCEQHSSEEQCCQVTWRYNQALSIALPS